MLHRLFAAAVLVVAPCVALVAQHAVDGGPTPETLYWRNSDGTPNRATGLLYRPELVSALIAGRDPATVPSRIQQAVQDQTPIVVMWAIPDGPAAREAVGPPRLFIRDTTSGNLVGPIWEVRDVRDLRHIDPRRPFPEIGMVGAFPRSAFQPGRIVVLFAPLPDDPATGAHRGVQVFGEFQETRLRPK
jgi:hypothetical protein